MSKNLEAIKKKRKFLRKSVTDRLKLITTQSQQDNTDFKQPWMAIPRRSTRSENGLVDNSLHNNLAIHLTWRWSLPKVWRCLENVNLFFNFTFEIRVFFSSQIWIMFKTSDIRSHGRKPLIFSSFFLVQKCKFAESMANAGGEFPAIAKNG